MLLPICSAACIWGQLYGMPIHGTSCFLVLSICHCWSAVKHVKKLECYKPNRDLKSRKQVDLNHSSRKAVLFQQLQKMLEYVQFLIQLLRNSNSETAGYYRRLPKNQKTAGVGKSKDLIRLYLLCKINKYPKC